MVVLNTTKQALRRLQILASTENGILENAEKVITLLECLFHKLRRPFVHQRNAFLSKDNVSLLLTILEKAKGDQQITKEILQVLVLLLKCEEKRVESEHFCALAIHRSGKAEFLESCFDLHRAEEEDVRAHEQIIRRALMASSARASLHEIHKIKRAMDLGITLDVFQQAQESFAAPSQRQQEINCDPKDRQVSDGVADITLVLTHMHKHLSRNEVVTAGLEAVVKHTQNDQNTIAIDLFLSEAFIAIIKTVLNSEDGYQHQLAMIVLLALTSNERFCHFFAMHRGCDTLMQVLLSDLALADELLQLALWTLSNLSKEGKQEVPHPYCDCNALVKVTTPTTANYHRTQPNEACRIRIEGVPPPIVQSYCTFATTLTVRR